MVPMSRLRDGPRYHPAPIASIFAEASCSSVYTALVGQTARRATAVFTDSEASRRDIVAHLGIPPEHVHAIHLAVDPAFQQVTDPTRLEQVRQRYGLPAGPFFLYLGGFDARKNLARLLQAYVRLRQQMDTAPSLVIAGKLPDNHSVFAPDPRVQAAELGLVDGLHFAGWVEEADKPALYSLALAALFPSEYEGFGLPVLEAQACGCPIITSSAAGP